MPINASESECDEDKRPVNRRNCNQIPCNRPNIEQTSSLASANTWNDIGKNIDFKNVSHFNWNYIY
jgi:hypothetical protein